MKGSFWRSRGYAAMKGSLWRSIVVMCLAQGLATALSPDIGMAASTFIGIYVACRLWFVDHPIVWWYDLLFLAVLVGTALGGAGVFAPLRRGGHRAAR